MLWSILGGLGGVSGPPKSVFLGLSVWSCPRYVILAYLILSYLTLSWISWKSLLSWVILGHDMPAKSGGLGPTGLLREYPQEPPKSPPRASKTPPRGPSGQIVGRFLIDFGCIFGKCFVDLWSIFDILIFVVNVLWACYLSKARWRGWPKATGSGAPEGVQLCWIELLNFLNRPYLSVLTIKTGPQIRADGALSP
jgi:hypothetical protein